MKRSTRTLAPLSALTLFLLGVALMIVVHGVAAGVEGMDAPSLRLLAILGLVLGWAAAALPSSLGWFTGLVGAIVGTLVLFLYTGRLGVEVAGVMAGLRTILLERSSPVDWTPFLQPLGELGAGSLVLLHRMTSGAWGWATWVQPDRLGTILSWSMATWTAAVWAGWVARRYRRAMPAVAPAGGLLAFALFGNLYRSGGWRLILYLGIALLLTALLHHEERERQWRSEALTLRSGMRPMVVAWAAGLSLLLVGLAVALPPVSIDDVIDLIQPVEYVYVYYDPPSELDIALPYEHPLGFGPTPSSDPLMFIHTDEMGVGMPEPPRYYWRALTYDVYNGRGWETSETETLVYQPGEPVHGERGWENPELEEEPAITTPSMRYVPTATQILTQPLHLGGADSTPEGPVLSITQPFSGRVYIVLPSGEDETEGITSTLEAASYRSIWQDVTFVEDSGGILHVAGTLLNVDEPVRVDWRSSGDLFGATVAAQTYHAQSLVSDVGAEPLRQAGTDYPAWVEERYLALPDTLPKRVRDVAYDVTATAPTPYDQALALEGYLRAFPYTLNVPPAPEDRDLVDYFLFDVQEGYCNYSASAMTVLARAAGLPARMVVGYASGAYDPDEARYIITPADAHAWVEIFFPGYGWIEFEPTSGQALPEWRVVEEQEAEEDFPALGIPAYPPAEAYELPAAPGMALRTWAGRGALGGLLALVVGIVGWLAVDEWRLRALDPQAAVGRLYRRLRRRARQLRVPLGAGDTPYEAGRAIEAHVDALEAPAAFVNGMQEARRVIELYVRSNYSPTPPNGETCGQAIRGWRRLRWQLVGLGLWAAWGRWRDRY